MTMLKLGAKAKTSKDPEAEPEVEAPKPKDNTTSKPRKLKQAGMSGRYIYRYIYMELGMWNMELKVSSTVIMYRKDTGALMFESF